ncbi:hypothetical protein RHMOL_Rhmol04G0172400 [Rhododendron molle]|uniref:Uncharacterized protein n=1 Tax=Rhododendron molle TaxID=49168 RepID=A0ACC0P2Z8_RHOML|nr:hypothetical protein RHMOL_Rhmol04G0172400 [Rhododendron molle]
MVYWSLGTPNDQRPSTMMSHSTVRLLLCVYAGNGRYVLALVRGTCYEPKPAFAYTKH